jgi:hypothetical protein
MEGEKLTEQVRWKSKEFKQLATFVDLNPLFK